ncbi:MAG: hypothetical protein ACJ8AH_11125 [Stellaceae bacterium]
MAATTRAEKPVRTGFDEQQGGAGAAALEAIDRLDQLLREEVIPRLPGQETQVEDKLDGANYDEEDEAPAVALAAGGTLPCRKGGPTAADKAVVKKIGPKLRGKLRGHLTADRICCARRIVAAVKARRLHRRAAVIAVTTTIVEASLLNVTYGDRDSLGLFQQRASWGSRAQRLNPTWATNAFLGAMLKKFPNNSWMKTPIGKVCQAVQVSAFPGRYQPEVADARTIVIALWAAGKTLAGTFAETEEPDDANQAALQAIQRIARMLTEEVIPQLSGDSGDEEPEPPDMPGEGEDEPLADDTPPAVTDAFEELYGTLSAEQAEALADLFTAIADAQAEGGENGSEPPGDEEPPEDAPETSRPGAGRPASRRTHEYA